MAGRSAKTPPGGGRGSPPGRTARSGRGAAPLADRYRQAVLDHQAGRLGAAEAGYRAVLAANPAFPGAALNYALLARAANRIAQALELAQRAVADDPAAPVAHNTLGNLLYEQERYLEAAAAYRAALALDPEHVNARFNLARALQGSGEPEAAAAEFQTLVERIPDDPEFRIGLGGALLDAGRIPAATEALRQALALAPDHPDALHELGLAHADVGAFEEAARCYRRVIDGHPDHPEIWLDYVKTRRFAPGDRAEITAAERVAERLARDPESSPAGATVHFALGKMHDDLGAYDQAFAHYHRGNAILHRHTRPEPEPPEALVDAIETTFDAAWFERVREWGDPTPQPIFIVGMPRAGTTLVEQILASHPAVHGAGELICIPNLARRLFSKTLDLPAAAARFTAADCEAAAADYLGYVASLADPGAARVTDKLPENYRFLGLIAALFPNARIIHVQRDPLDICVSNYFTRFQRGHAYSYDFASLIQTYRAYARLMDHWRRVLPLPLREQSYEALVSEFEPEARALVEDCGLVWDTGCLAFHRTERPVHTASSWQVRQPAHRRSVQRWRHYERHLGPLIAALQRGVVPPVP